MRERARGSGSCPRVREACSGCWRDAAADRRGRCGGGTAAGGDWPENDDAAGADCEGAESGGEEGGVGKSGRSVGRSFPRSPG